MTIDLQKFCSTDKSRNHLHAPFSRGGYTWATNGHIALRLPLREDIPENDQSPNIERVWRDGVGEYVPVTPWIVPKPDRKDCEMCDARGTLHECPSCTCECEECEGTGYVDEIQSVTVGSADIQAKYAALMMTLPGLAVIVPEKDDTKSMMLHFRFDGGEGILMKLRENSYACVGDLLKGASE